MAAAPPGHEADAFAHAELARQLLLSEGLDAEIVVGFAAWRLGPGEGDIVIQGSGRATAAAEQSETGNEHAHHAWLETGGHVFDVTTYRLVRIGAELDRRDGKTTNVTWCPQFVLVPRDELSSFARVRQEVAGRMYYERDAYLQTVVASRVRAGGYPDIAYEEHGDGASRVGVLHFAFYNGAMGSAQCERLLAAYRAALLRPTRVLLLAGGPDFFSNGIHLNLIEAADSPADESWRNINAIDDVCEAILATTDRWVAAALQGNAGAGGAFLALTADDVWARAGVILNPHYKNMGNLYGSEYWTYTLPRRFQAAGGSAADAARVMDNRLPVTAAQARALGLVDKVFDTDRAGFLPAAIARAQQIACSPDIDARLDRKQAQRQHDEAQRPLAAYRADELARMRRNFYGFDSSYHVARSYFVRKTPPSWTPRHLAVHRDQATARGDAGA